MKELAKYISIPFEERGRSHNGVDCWGLIFLVYRDILKIELPTYLEGYENLEDRKEISNIMSNDKHILWEEVETPKLYDVCLFNMVRVPMHVGLCLDKISFMHSFKGNEVCIEKFNNIKWNKRIVGFYRHKSLI